MPRKRLALLTSKNRSTLEVELEIGLELEFVMSWIEKEFPRTFVFMSEVGITPDMAIRSKEVVWLFNQGAEQLSLPYIHPQDDVVGTFERFERELSLRAEMGMSIEGKPAAGQGEAG